MICRSHKLKVLAHLMFEPTQHSTKMDDRLNHNADSAVEIPLKFLFAINTFFFIFFFIF